MCNFFCYTVSQGRVLEAHIGFRRKLLVDSGNRASRQPHNGPKSTLPPSYRQPTDKGWKKKKNNLSHVRTTLKVSITGHLLALLGSFQFHKKNNIIFQLVKNGAQDSRVQKAGETMMSSYTLQLVDLDGLLYHTAARVVHRFLHGLKKPTVAPAQAIWLLLLLVHYSSGTERSV